jgi:hypothetical protein
MAANRFIFPSVILATILLAWTVMYRYAEPRTPQVGWTDRTRVGSQAAQLPGLGEQPG